MERGVQKNGKEEQTLTVLLNLTRLSVWLDYYYNNLLDRDKRTAK